MDIMQPARVNLVYRARQHRTSTDIYDVKVTVNIYDRTSTAIYDIKVTVNTT